MTCNLDIRLLIPGLPFDALNPFANSLGGSETAGLQLAAALAKAGHTVTAFASVEKPGSWQSVNIAPSSNFADVQRGIPSDLVIVQRSPLAFSNRMASKVNFLWTHDLLMARRKQELLGCLHSIDRIVTVSDWQRRQHQQVGGDIPDSMFLVSRNGIDLELITQAAATAPERDPNLIVCTARPERGVDVLLTRIFPALLERWPQARLALATYAYPGTNLGQFYEHMANVAAKLGDRCEDHGALNKLDLYRLMHRGSLYLYPTPSPGDPSFADTSCIAVMEAMACGLPVVASMRGALPETLGNAGLLVDFQGDHCATEAATTAFVDAALKVLREPEPWTVLHQRGLERASGLGWDAVATQVVDHALGILREQCSDPVRLARHFIRRQDIEAAKATVAAASNNGLIENPGHFIIPDEGKVDELIEIDTWLQKRFAHTDSPERLAAFYAEQVGPGNDHVFHALMAQPKARFHEQCYGRFALIDVAIRRNLGLPEHGMLEPTDPPLRVLDFGCAQGECPIVLSNRLGATVFGVDASWSEVERAGLLAEQHADQPDRLGFALANESDLSAIEHDREESGAYDALVLGEILEHVIDPVELLTRLERMVQPGGVVVITMPYGPWATNKPEWERGQHLREWDVGDLRDVLHGKASLIIDRVPNGTCPVSGEILGFTVASYTADQKSLGQLDWSRKLTMHRPRQTLSVTMIVGGATAHETLHWCLASVMPAADELVVADCGITPEARRILEQHDARIVPGSNPLSEGFETPRNLSLAACREDWALMIDSDERLLSAATMWPYLRENCYHTYAIPQHHFAVDSNWKPDMPGRLFRRRPDEEGRTLRVIGKLHEHPEFAPNAGAGRAIVMHNVRIAHVGYLEQAIRAERFVRNLPLLQRDLEAYPDRKLGLLVLCRDSVIQAKWLTLISGRDPNQPGCALGNAQVANLCRDVVRVWERAFMADDSHMANESMEHYHEACKMLGTDVVANAGISVQRQGIGGSVGNGAQHFASIEHFEAYMAGRLKAAVTPLSGHGF